MEEIDFDTVPCTIRNEGVASSEIIQLVCEAHKNGDCDDVQLRCVLMVLQEVKLCNDTKRVLIERQEENLIVQDTLRRININLTMEEE